MRRALSRQLQDVADDQAGVLSGRQLLAAGLHRGVIRSAVDSGHWRRLHPGVFQIHAGPTSDTGRLWVALLAIGPPAALSHRTAGRLWGLGHERPAHEIVDLSEAVDVLVPHARHVGAPAGVRLHRRRDITAILAAVGSPPRTTVEVTVIDLAAAARSIGEVVAVASVVCQQRRTTPARLLRELRRRDRHAHRQFLEALLCDVAAGAETPLEIGFLRRVERAHGLPRGRRQHRMPTTGGLMVVDVFYEDSRTIAELDGRIGHEAPFRDEERDNFAAVRGGTTLRYGWVAVFERPCRVAGQLGGVLLDRGWAGPIRPCGPGCPAPGVGRRAA